MESAEELIQINDLPGLDRHLELWSEGGTKNNPIGYILSLEGADSIVDLHHLEKSYSSGLRALGPAHYGPGTYAQGTDATGGIGRKGRELLKEMEALNIILDVTHLCEDSFWEALDHFHGPLWASHSNVRVLVDHNRQLSDNQIQTLIDRDAVIGGPLDAWMMVPGWERGISDPKNMMVSLSTLVDHLDHICQIAGNSFHTGIGTDLDGGFGKEQCPHDLDTIADLQTLPELFKKRGYTDEDIENILNKNFIRFLRRAWNNNF
jgi:membrane dipeptidase